MRDTRFYMPIEPMKYYLQKKKLVSRQGKVCGYDFSFFLNLMAPSPKSLVYKYEKNKKQNV